MLTYFVNTNLKLWVLSRVWILRCMAWHRTALSSFRFLKMHLLILHFDCILKTMVNFYWVNPLFLLLVISNWHGNWYRLLSRKRLLKSNMDFKNHVNWTICWKDDLSKNMSARTLWKCPYTMWILIIEKCIKYKEGWTQQLKE